MMLGAIIMLGMFASRVTRAVRRQVINNMLSISILLVFAIIKAVYLDKNGINIPVATIFLPANLLLFYSLFRHSLFTTSPIGRDKAFDVIEQGIVVVDGSGMIVDRNPFTVQLFKTWFGIDAEMTGQSMETVFSAFPLWVELTKSNSAGQFEVQSSHEGAGDCYFRFKVYPLQTGSGGTVTIIRDITQRRLQEQELKNRADTDCLTGLLNKNGFMDVFMRQLKETEGTGDSISMLILDLDRFKTVNDTYGHINGDRVLVLFSDLLRGTLRQQDAIGRIGGDEFAASLPGVSRTEALHIAERIRERAAEQGVEMEDGDVVHFTVSIGIADSADRLNKGAPPQADDLIKLADKAMYRAKRVSRNCCVVGE
jgi:diguanylate cyclase (GGDEF)-like protein